MAARRCVVVVCALAIVSCNRLTGPSAVDGDWTVARSTHFAIHARPGSFASQHLAQFAAVLEDQYAVSLAKLDAVYDGQISAILYDSPSEGRFESPRSGVAFPLADSFAVVATAPLDANLFGLMTHEANHVIARHAIGPPGTSFANEGLASALNSDRFNTHTSWYTHQWVGERLSSVPPLRTLVVDDGWSAFPDERLKYRVADSFLARLLDTDGPGKLKQLFVSRSEGFVDRFGSIYGRPLDQAEASWKEFVRAAAGR